MSNPTLLHLLPLSTYRAEPASAIGSPSLEQEGFVHCSADLPITLAIANSLYTSVDEPMVAVELDPSRLSAPVRWEEAAPEPPPGIAADVLFPHVYGPLDREAVVDVLYARRDVSGRYISLERRGATADEFDLLPHPEGGWYRRTWSSSVEVTEPTKSGIRPTATAIYFLLPGGRTSEWHTVASDELWFWHRGGPLTLSHGGQGARPVEQPERVVLDAGDKGVPQAAVRAGTWQRAEAGSTETLVSCVVSPGFDFADFRTL